MRRPPCASRRTLAAVADPALHPPGGVGRDGDPRLADRLADLPGRPLPVLLDLELGREPEVALAPRGEADVTADARDPERPHRLALDVVADEVPDAVVVQQGVRVDQALGLLVA